MYTSKMIVINILQLNLNEKKIPLKRKGCQVVVSVLFFCETFRNFCERQSQLVNLLTAITSRVAAGSLTIGTVLSKIN